MLLLLASILLSATTLEDVPAVDDPIALSWQSEPACGSAQQLRARVEELIALPKEQRAPLVVHAAAQQRAGRWTLRLELGTSGTPRLLAGETCEGLLEAAAVVIALAAQRAAAEAPPAAPPALIPDASEAAPATSMPSPPVPSPVPATPPARPRAVVIEVAARVGLGAELGATGPSGMSADVAAVAAVDPFSIGLGARLGIGQASGDGRGTLIWLVAGALRACWSPTRPGHIALGVCAVFEVGGVEGRAVGITDPDVAGGPWAAVGGEIFARYDGFGRWRPWIALDVAGPLTRFRFTYARVDGNGGAEPHTVELFVTPRVISRASAGLEWLFW